MELREGMLGVVVIALAMAGALFVAYLSGIESEDVEVTRYQEIADVSMLFDYDQSPQFIDYDPSTNYVGYYSGKSYSPTWGKYFFAEEDVSYVPNVDSGGRPIINNYKISLDPEMSATTTVQLSALQNVDRGNFAWIYYYYSEQGDRVMWECDADTDNSAILLSNVIATLEIPEEFTNFRISLGDDVNWDDRPVSTGWFSNELDLRTCLIIPVSRSSVYLTSPSIDPSTIENVDREVSKPYQSIDVDLRTGIAKCYYTSDYSGTADSKRTDALLLCGGDHHWSSSIIKVGDALNLGDQFDYTVYKIRTDYLDPKFGVQLTEG